ncbi:MAG: hypothetical protein AB1411_06475 [Nitrospirota bacterium]
MGSDPLIAAQLTAESLPSVPDEVRQTLRAYLKEVLPLFSPTLEAAVLYGSAARGEFLAGRSNLNLLFVLSRHDLTVLQRYAAAHRRWSKEQIVAPLLLTQGELRASSRLFPLEYLEIKECHLLLAGRDPFPDLSVDPKALLLSCEQELSGNLLRLRQRLAEGNGRPDAMLLLLPLSLTSLVPCLRGFLSLLGCQPKGTTEELLQEIKPALDLDSAVFLDVFHLKRGEISPGPVEIPRLFERYLVGLQALRERVETLKEQGRLST